MIEALAVVAGVALVVAGLWLAWPPVGLIGAGVGVLLLVNAAAS